MSDRFLFYCHEVILIRWRGGRPGFVSDVDLEVADAALFPFLLEVIELCGAAEDGFFILFAGVNCVY